MPEEIKNPAANGGADKQTPGGEGQGGEGTDLNKKPDGSEAGGEGAGSGEGGGGDQDPNKGQDKNAKAPNEKPKEGDENDDDGKEPPTRPRLSKQDFIIGRQHSKLKKAGKPADEGGNGDGGEKDPDDDNKEVDPEDENLVRKVIAPIIAPLIDKSLSADDDAEIQGFLKDNPDFKKFESKVRRFMAHPSRRQLPIKTIFYEVAGDQLLKIGAEREREATRKANGTQTGGGSNRTGEEAKNDWELPPDEFEAKKERIRRGEKP